MNKLLSLLTIGVALSFGAAQAQDKPKTEQQSKMATCNKDAADKKGDERKLALAAAIRTRTSVPNAWIARELHLGHVSRVSRCVQNAPAKLIHELSAILEK